MNDEILRGDIGEGMPTPEQEFQRVTGEVFDPEQYEIIYDGAMDDGYDSPIVPYRIVRKTNAISNEKPANVIDQETINNNFSDDIENAQRDWENDWINAYPGNTVEETTDKTLTLDAEIKGLEENVNAAMNNFVEAEADLGRDPHNLEYNEAYQRAIAELEKAQDHLDQAIAAKNVENQETINNNFSDDIESVQREWENDWINASATNEEPKKGGFYEAELREAQENLGHAREVFEEVSRKLAALNRADSGATQAMIDQAQEEYEKAFDAVIAAEQVLEKVNNAINAATNFEEAVRNLEAMRSMDSGATQAMIGQAENNFEQAFNTKVTTEKELREALNKREKANKDNKENEQVKPTEEKNETKYSENKKEKITLYIDREKNKVYARDYVFKRFSNRISRAGEPEKFNNLTLIPMNLEDAKYIIDNADNEYSPYDINYVEVQMKKTNNHPIQLDNGDGVSRKEIEEAMNNYINPSPKPTPPPIPPQPPRIPTETEPPVTKDPIKDPIGENKRHKVVKKRKCRFRIWPIIVSAVMTALMALGIGGKQAEVIASKVNGEYKITEESTQTNFETSEEALERALKEFETSDTVTIKDGVIYHESSDYANGGANANAPIGNPLRPEGEYVVNYVSILDANGNITAVEYNQNKNVQEFISETAEKLGVNENNLTAKLHIATTKGGQTGWIDYDDFVKGLDTTPQAKGTETVPVSSQSGYIEDFNGTIDIEENGQKVSINLVKDDGTIYQPGEEVVGSNGVTYRLDNLELYNVRPDENTNKNFISWSLSNINDLEKLAIAGAAVASALAFKKKEEEEEIEIKNQDELDKMLEEDGYNESRNNNLAGVKTYREGIDIARETISQPYEASDSAKGR